MRKYRVLQVGKFYAPCPGGIERVVQDLAEGLKDEFDTRVLVCSHRGSSARDVVNGIPVFRAETPMVALSMPLSMEFVTLLGELSSDCDLIHFHHPFPLVQLAALFHRWRKQKIVLTYHSDIVSQRALAPLYGPLLRGFLRRCDRIHVASERLRMHSPYLQRLGDRCRAVPFGARLEELREKPEPFDLPARDYVLFVGRLVPYKGAEYLIRAMKDVAMPLLIVGDGPLKESLQGLARELGIGSRVHFVGGLSRARLRYVYEQCRLFVLPSVLESEAFGIVQLEALAFGKPVVNTDLPTGVPEVSRHGETGLTVPPRNSVALAEAIHKIVGDPALYERYAQAALRRAEELSMERFLSGMRNVYHEALNGTAGHLPAAIGAESKAPWKR